MNTKRLYTLLGGGPGYIVGNIWTHRIAALFQRGDELDVPTLLAAWQEQGGTWAEMFVLYKALVSTGDAPDVGLWRRIAEATGDPWIASNIEGTIWTAAAFAENAAAVQATPAYWSDGLEAYRAAYQRAAGSFLGMLMEALGEPVREVLVPAPEYVRLRVIVLIRPPYAGMWHGLYPCHLRIHRFETWASVDADPEEVQAFVLRQPEGRRSVYAFRSNRDVRFEWGKNGRVQERLVIPAGIPWCTFPSIEQCRDEVMDIETLEPWPTPGRQALVDSNYRW